MLTVAQFRELPEGGEFEHELHHGEVVASTRKVSASGVVSVEWPYPPLAEFELRVADVAVIAHARWDAIDLDDNLYGAPDLVIEIKPPSNSRKQLQELVALCLANGAAECWILDPVNLCVIFDAITPKPD